MPARWRAASRHGSPEEAPGSCPGGLSVAQQARYDRHIRLPEVGEAGQQELLEARVLVVGAGGLGSPAALYLAAAGVGTIGIADHDRVDISNLQRQILHNVRWVGQKKVESARDMLGGLNPDVTVEAHDTRLEAAGVLDLLKGYDLVVDGTDNFPTRYLLNDASIRLGIPVVHGSVFRFEGQVSTFDPGSGPCYRCLFPEPPSPDLAPDCNEAGVLGVLPGVIGTLQAVEALKHLLDIGDTLVGRILLYDAPGPGVPHPDLRQSRQLPGLRRPGQPPAPGRLRRDLHRPRTSITFRQTNPAERVHRSSRQSRSRPANPRDHRRCNYLLIRTETDSPSCLNSKPI